MLRVAVVPPILEIEPSKLNIILQVKNDQFMKSTYILWPSFFNSRSISRRYFQCCLKSVVRSVVVQTVGVASFHFGCGCFCVACQSAPATFTRLGLNRPPLSLDSFEKNVALQYCMIIQREYLLSRNIIANALLCMKKTVLVLLAWWWRCSLVVSGISS